MFESNEAVARMVDDLFQVCSFLERGDVLTREAIEEVVGVSPNTAHWGYVVFKTRKRVERERYISMMPVTNVGFKLCTVQEQIDLGEYRQHRASRQLRRGERSLKALGRVSGLSMHQKRMRLAALESVRQSRLKIAEQLRLSRSITQPTPSLPRRPAELLPGLR